MAVIKQGPRPEDHYTLIPNSLSRNPDIPPRAKAVYLYLRSHSDGWKITTERVAESLDMGKNTVTSALKDLESSGYIQRCQVRSDGGVFEGWEYEVLSDPVTVSPKTGHGKTPYPKNTDVGKIGIHKKTNSSKKTKPQEDQNPKTEFGAEFDTFWKAYPRKAGKQKAQTKFEEQISNGASPDDLVKASTNFRAETERQQTETRYIPYPSTFLNQERWRDYLKAPAMSAADKRRESIKKLENLEL